jgi:hypothetical protein
MIERGLNRCEEMMSRIYSLCPRSFFWRIGEIRKGFEPTGISAGPGITRVFVFNQLGDIERCALRLGNVISADGWRVVLEPVIARGTQ